MKKLSIFYYILLLGLIAIITSCSEDIAITDQLADNEQVLETRGKKIDKSFSGEYYTIPNVVGFTPDGFLIVEFTSEGIATHVGKSTWYGIQVVQPIPGEEGYSNIDGLEFIITAASGDRFWGTYDGIGFSENPPLGPVSFSGSMYVEDGDGRFAGASGNLPYYGEATLQGGHFVIEGGTLTY